ncbi:hypothetical protein F0562_000748 [Nyssa sinensis]|uniref:RRM domain-containing protein n=1 Tax=Nyssa sinensis TaxID=561372 RepID=A0A5J5C2I6_9ASTE|nr:hypothetical protein F0562_000748 [Nyssa sinensis]
MDRQRGDYSDSHRNSHSATTSWPADDPATHHDRNYDNQRGDFSNDGYHFHHQHYRRYDHHHHLSNDRHHYNFNGELNDSSGIGNGNDDIGSGHSGRKRQFSHSGHGASADYNDAGSYVKLYVGAIPRTATEDNIRSLFEEHGNIVEIVLLKDKRTGQQQECCFVKYATLEEADRAIGALHNQYTFPGGVVPIKVRYAEGERERLGNCPIIKHGGFGEKCKLYVGGLNKQALKREVEEIFSPYGLVEDIYVVRDELKQNRGCGFIQFSHRNMAVAAINALNGTYIMRGCDQPLVVRFADPKKPRTGETRCNSRFGGQGFGPRYQEPVVRPAPYLSEPTSGHMLTNSLHPPSPKSVASSSQGGPIGVIGGPASGTLLGTWFTIFSTSVSTDWKQVSDSF